MTELLSDTQMMAVSPAETAERTAVALVRAESVRRALIRYELAATRQRNAARARLGLGFEELTTLLYVEEHGPVAQRELLGLSARSRSAVGAMVRRLEAAHLIERIPDRRDRRLRLLRLSEEGMKRLREACDAHDQEIERVLIGRSDADLRALSELLQAISEAAHPDNGSTAPLEPGDWCRWG